MITEDVVYRLDVGGQQEIKALMNWQSELADQDGFDPVVIGGAIEAPDPLNPDRRVLVDGIGIVTVHDGPSLATGEIIAPPSAASGTTRTITTTTRTPRRSSGPAVVAVVSTRP